jgi:hypothetical protein
MTRKTLQAPMLFALLWPSLLCAQPTVSDTSVPSKSSAAADASNVPSSSGTKAATAQPSSSVSFRVGSDVADKNSATLPSSSRPSSNAESSQDGFDLNVGSRDNTVRGGKGSFAITGQSVQAIAVPDIHTVRRGDTLWDLCGHYLGDSWEWPRIWSYNPDIRNPNWIYPGDEIRMRSPDEQGRGPYSTQLRGRELMGRAGSGADAFGRTSKAVPGTIFLRNEAYIEEPERDVIGEVVGAREEQMLLGQDNHVYLDVKPDVELKAGQELTLFEQSRKPEPVEGARQPPGEIVLIKGTLRVEEFDTKKHVASARVIESADAIERGTKVGSVGRRYLVVPPTPAKATVWARLLTGIYPHVFLGQQQLVFVDRGSEDGLAPGNRLFVIRRGDTWRRSLTMASPSASARYRMRVDVPGHAETEATQIKRDDNDFPEEIVGEIRIVAAHRWSSLALVTVSHAELVSGDRAVAREGR